MFFTNLHPRTGALLLVLGLMAIFAATAAAVAAPATLDLSSVLRLALTESPAVNRATRDWQAAEQALRSARADLGWRATASTNKAWTIKQEKQGAVAAELRSTLELEKSGSVGQTWSLMLDPVTLTRKDGATSSSLGAVTLGWSVRALGPPSPVAQALRERERQVQQKQAALDLARESAAVNAAKAFFDALKARLDLQVAEEQLHAQALAAERTQAMVQVGRASPQEADVAAARLALARVDVEGKKQQLEVATRDVWRYLGVTAPDMAQAAWVGPAWLPAIAAPEEHWLEKALARPEVRQAELAVLAAEDAWREAQAAQAYDVKPLISFDTSSGMFSAGVDITRPKESLGGSLAASWRLQADGNWAISTQFSTTLGGANAYEKAAWDRQNAESDLVASQIALEQAREDATDKVRTLWNDVAAKALQEELQAALVAKERLNLEVAETRVAVGAATPVDLADARAAFTQAKAGVEKALFERQLAFIKLLAAVGDFADLARLEEEFDGQT